MNIYIFDQNKTLYQEASARIISRVRHQSSIILGLATGQSPLGIYHEMIKDHQMNHTNYSNVVTFNLDEYVGLSSKDEQSYYHFMKKELFNPLSIPIQSTHIPSGIATSLIQECERYDKLLDHHPIDIQILGIGSNGHIGFNEPGTLFDSRTHVIQLDQKTRRDNSRFFNSINEVPTQAITMGIRDIVNAKEIILVAVGSSKSDAVFHMIKGPLTIDCPASVLQEHPNVHVFLDKAAASKIIEK